MSRRGGAGENVVVIGGWRSLAAQVGRRLARDRYRVRMVGGPGSDPDPERISGQRPVTASGSSEEDLERSLAETRVAVLTIDEPFAPLTTETRKMITDRTEMVARWAARSEENVLVLASSSYIYGPIHAGSRAVHRDRPETDHDHLMLDVESRLLGSLPRGKSRGVVFRLPHVYGPGAPLTHYLTAGVLPVVGDLDTVTSHVHVDDAARAVTRAIGNGIEGVFPLADTRAASWREVFDFLSAEIGRLEVIALDQSHLIRAHRWLGRISPLPSALTPGTGWGWSCEQQIDASSTWERLEIGPRYPSYRSGLGAMLTQLGMSAGGQAARSGR